MKNKNNLIVLGIALVAILISSLSKCNRNFTPEDVELQRLKVDSLERVLDSLNQLELQYDTVRLYKTKWKTNTIYDTINIVEYSNYEPQVLSTQFTKDDVDLKITITVQNSEVLDFDYELENTRNQQSNTYLDTVYAVVHETVYDTIPVTPPIQKKLPVYKPRHFNVGFAVVADPTLEQIAPGLSISFKQHELLGYYNVLDKTSTERFGLMYRYEFWKNYKIVD